MKQNIFLGLIYGLIWFAITELVAITDLMFPLSWSIMIMENESFSESFKIFAVRGLWAIEFSLYIILAALLTMMLVKKLKRSLNSIDVVKIALTALLILSVYLWALIPRFVPYYQGILFWVICFPSCLYISNGAIKYITSYSNGR